MLGGTISAPSRTVCSTSRTARIPSALRNALRNALRASTHAMRPAGLVVAGPLLAGGRIRQRLHAVADP